MDQTLIEGTDFYYDDCGNMVFTAKFHLEKGYCCGHGCKHCPFEYECVPEPKKTCLFNMGYPILQSPTAP